jgi:hypothetical protein
MLGSVSERLARGGVVVVLIGAVVAVIVGALAVPGWLPEPPPDRVKYVDPCPDPPCFGGGPAPSLADVPVFAHLLVFALALLLSGLASAIGLVEALRHRGTRGLVLGLAAVGVTLMVLIGGEIVPHLLNPCVMPRWVGAATPGFCEAGPGGYDVPGNWHLLDHALVGFLPLALVFAWWWSRLAGTAAGATSR